MAAINFEGIVSSSSSSASGWDDCSGGGGCCTEKKPTKSLECAKEKKRERERLGASIRVDCYSHLCFLLLLPVHLV